MREYGYMCFMHSQQCFVGSKAHSVLIVDAYVIVLQLYKDIRGPKTRSRAGQRVCPSELFGALMPS